MTTRPDVQRKRDQATRKRDAERRRQNAEAFELEKRAASQGHTLVVMLEEIVRLQVQAALLRQKARG